VVSGTGVNTTLRSTSTGLPQQPDWLNSSFAAGDFNGDGISDLWVIHRQDGSNRTAFRIMNGANLGWLLADRITALPILDNSTAFAVMDYNRDEVPDLWAITPRDPSGKVRVRIVSGASPNTVLVDRLTSQAASYAYADINYAAADYNADGYADLWFITPRDASGMVRVRVLSGRDWSTVLRDSAVPLGTQSTHSSNYGFMVSDYNQDSFPDLWHIDRRSSVVTVISGSSFSDIFFSSASALPATNSRDWLILGSDRSREPLAPEPPSIKKLDPNTEFTEPYFVLRFTASGLAERFTVLLTEASGAEVGRYSFSESTQHCNAVNCFIDTRLITSSLRDARQYFVQVVAENSYGPSYSERIPFTVDVPGPNELVTPGYMSVITADQPPVYIFKANPLATRYTFRTRTLDRVTYDFRRAYFAWEICTADLCTVALDHVPPVGNYWWRVVSRDEGTGESYSHRFLYDIVPPDALRTVPLDAGGALALPPEPALDPAPTDTSGDADISEPTPESVEPVELVETAAPEEPVESAATEAPAPIEEPANVGD
jgi:hypothetical protein